MEAQPLDEMESRSCCTAMGCVLCPCETAWTNRSSDADAQLPALYAASWGGTALQDAATITFGDAPDVAWLVFMLQVFGMERQVSLQGSLASPRSAAHAALMTLLFLCGAGEVVLWGLGAAAHPETLQANLVQFLSVLLWAVGAVVAIPGMFLTAQPAWASALFRTALDSGDPVLRDAVLRNARIALRTACTLLVALCMMVVVVGFMTLYQPNTASGQPEGLAIILAHGAPAFVHALGQAVLWMGGCAWFAGTLCTFLPVVGGLTTSLNALAKQVHLGTAGGDGDVVARLQEVRRGAFAVQGAMGVFLPLFLVCTLGSVVLDMYSFASQPADAATTVAPAVWSVCAAVLGALVLGTAARLHSAANITLVDACLMTPPPSHAPAGDSKATAPHMPPTALGPDAIVAVRALAGNTGVRLGGAVLVTYPLIQATVSLTVSVFLLMYQNTLR